MKIIYFLLTLTEMRGVFYQNISLLLTFSRLRVKRKAIIKIQKTITAVKK